MELQHFCHEHPLTLCDNGKYDLDILCYGCNLLLSGDAYKCGECEFIIHKKSCAELPDKIIHFLHPKHHLTLFTKPPYGRLNPRCNNCEERVWGFFYHCSICDYDLDLKCVFLSEVLKHEGHKHSFILFRPMKFTCDACGEIGDDMSYLCTGCQLMLHKACALVPPPGKLISAEQTIGEDEATLSLITKGANDISLEEKGKLTEIDHFSHSCRLTLNDTNDLLTLNDDDPLDEEKCDACVRPLSAPFYACAPCKYFLHLTCARLPITTQNAHHPHRLTLLSKVKANNPGLFECTICGRLCGGFAYVCELCDYFIDINCALLLKTNRLVSPTHEHVLNLVQKMHPAICNGCKKPHWLVFRCNDCDFNICMECAALPLTARHAWDEKHLLKLTTVNIEHASGKYFCDLCEEDRDPEHWYYSCKECDLSFHQRCLFGRFKIKFGGKFKISGHPGHDVYLMEKMKDHLRCKTLCQLKETDLFVVECRTCDYHCHLGYRYDMRGTGKVIQLVQNKKPALK